MHYLHQYSELKMKCFKKKNWMCRQNFKFIMMLIGIYLKEIALLIAIRLSWKFSHSQYEMICSKRCNSCVKQYCKDLVNKGIEKEINLIPLKQRLL